MKTINPNNLNQKDNYKLLSASVVPRPIAFVTTLNDDNSLNGAPFSFFTVLTAKPPLIMLSILRKDGGVMKDTARNILRNKEYVVHLTTMDNIEKINLTAALLDVNVSEVDLAKLTKVKSELIKTPGVKEAKIRFEVTLDKHIELGDEDEITADLLIGRVKLYHLHSDIYQNSYINFENLRPIGRLAGNDFLTKDGFKEIIRPK
ncbi:MAG TPA: flavin reductase family protein [Acholeplasma sp.]|nr:flavin reductase family protein [Acholeplasma sp.]